MTEETFTKKMRKATREIHAISDALVNAKLVFAASDDRVWADGLLVFYEVFRYLEEAMERLSNTHVGTLRIEGMKRTEAFEKDLAFYLTPDWTKHYNIRDSVAKYLLHLHNLETEDPNLLMAYIYHLYMGLLSGGQILKRKREIFSKLFRSGPQTGGNAVVDFGDFKIAKIKRDLVAAMNSIADELDEQTKSKLIEESKMVFVLNNEIIKSVQGTSYVILKKCIVTVFIILLILIAYFMLSRYFF